MTTTADETGPRELAAKFIEFLETGTPPDGPVHRGRVLRLHDAAVAPAVPRRRGHRRPAQGRPPGAGPGAPLPLRRDHDRVRAGGGGGVGPGRRVVVLPGAVPGRRGRRRHLAALGVLHRRLGPAPWWLATARRLSCCARRHGGGRPYDRVDGRRRPGPPAGPPITWRRPRHAALGRCRRHAGRAGRRVRRGAAAGDTEAMADAPRWPCRRSQRFGVYPGQIPALLHEAYTAADTPTTRCRLAAALARSWVYGGDARAAARFADDAQRLAAEVATPEAIGRRARRRALAHWGPDDFAERVSLAARLDDVAAHLRRPRPAPLRASVAAHHRVGVPRHRRGTAPAPGARRGRRRSRARPGPRSSPCPAARCTRSPPATWPRPSS